MIEFVLLPEIMSILRGHSEKKISDSLKHSELKFR